MYNDQESGYNNTGFMNSDSLVAKIIFLLIVIFIFVIVLQLAIQIMTWLFTAFKSPLLINGMVDAKQMLIIPQDPSIKDANTILRSVNEDSGIEFTWSVWIMIDDLQYMAGKYKHIFHKGNDSIAPNGLNFPNNGPGLYIAPNTNDLVVIMNTFNVINEEITISDIPLNKWINVVIRCKNTTIDVYINGMVTKSVKLLGVPKQNYGDVYIAMDSGFSGYISNLSYYNYAISTSEIRGIMQKGPNTKNVSSSTGDPNNKNNLDYLSLRWYFYGSQ